MMYSLIHGNKIQLSRSRPCTGIEVKTEVDDDLIRARDGKAGSEWLCSEILLIQTTSDHFDPLKKTKLKSFKDLKAVRKVCNKNLIRPLRMNRDVFARMALLGEFRQIDMTRIVELSVVVNNL